MSNKIQLFIILVLLSNYSFADFKQGGEDYKNGDYESAVKHFEEAAKLNDHRAMYALGSMYAGGQGVEQDYKKAYTWFRKADKHGRTDAQYKLGLMYEQGLGLKKNNKKAARWYSKAANGGYPPGQYKMGMMYAKGLGVKQNPVKAYAWLSAALPVLKQGKSSGDSEGVDPITEIETTLEELQVSMNTEQLQEAMVMLRKIIR